MEDIPTMQKYMYKKALVFLSDFMFARNIFQSKDKFSSSEELLRNNILNDNECKPNVERIRCRANKDQSLSITYYYSTYVNNPRLKSRVCYQLVY